MMPIPPRASLTPAMLCLAMRVLPAETSETEIKQRVLSSLEAHRQEIVGISDRIWELAETALLEY